LDVEYTSFSKTSVQLPPQKRDGYLTGLQSRRFLGGVRVRFFVQLQRPIG